MVTPDPTRPRDDESAAEDAADADEPAGADDVGGDVAATDDAVAGTDDALAEEPTPEEALSDDSADGVTPEESAPVEASSVPESSEAQSPAVAASASPASIVTGAAAVASLAEANSTEPEPAVPTAPGPNIADSNAAGAPTDAPVETQTGERPVYWHPDSLPKPQHQRSKRTFWWIIGGAVVALIAAIVAVVLIVTSSVAPAHAEGLVLLRDIQDRPTVGDWQLDNPLADAVPSGTSVYVNGYTVGAESALFVWSADRPSGTTTSSPAGETRMSLVDTVSGKQLWERRVTDLSTDFDPYDTPVVVSPPDSEAIVLSLGDLMVSISRADGAVVSRSDAHSSVEGIGFPDFSAPSSFVPTLGGDLLITSTRDGSGKVGRYASTNLTKPIWEVEGEPGERPVVAGDKLFFDDRVFSLTTGKELAWKGDLDWYYQSVGDHLIAIDYSGNETTIRGVDENTGEPTWTSKQSLPVVLDTTGLLVVADQAGGNVRRLDPSDGSVEWKSDVTSTWNGAYTVGEMIMLSDGDGGYTGIDAGSGEERYRSSTADGSLVGFSDRTLFLTLDDRLVAYDVRTGDRQWRINAPGDEYGFSAWGGTPLAVAAQLPAGSEKPAVLGLGAK
ncbi:PQQ-binding-like beta-propeller repeat protein [Plantibacter sp. YIM 135347]|uniref:outer membrane protein assembly factor BamB family protein n=1 Tax=Plantibacter sp. YIM 135347 TaxID=3423919 RepID=UPI003D32A182